MDIKSSNKKHFVFIVVLFTALLLLLMQNGKANKYQKYPSTPDFEQNTPLDFLQITLNEKQYNKLKKKRDKALSNGILETKNTDYVPAKITFKGVDYKAEIRLKGDWTDHLKGDKWSFRVKLKGDKTIMGMRKFSIHHPKTRGYLNEWLYHKAVKKEGLIGLRYEFIEGSIHIKQKNSNSYINKSLGIYAIEETFDKRMIENNKRKESIVLKFSEESWWNEVKKSAIVGEPFGLKGNKFMKGGREYPVKLFSEGKLLNDSTMNNYFKLSKHLIKDIENDSLPISSVFDAKEVAMQNSILNLFGAKHGNYIINLRFYYNPITSKLEPVAFDGNSGHRLDEYVPFHFIKNSKKIDTIYLKELIFALNKVSKPEYLEKLILDNKKDISRYENILKSEFKYCKLSFENLRYNQFKIIKNKLNKLQSKFNIKVEKISKPFSIQIPKVSKWKNNRSILTKLKIIYKTESIYSLKRSNNKSSSFCSIDNIPVNYGENYKVSFLVKKGDLGQFFGLRIQGKYPHRVDAVFDLEKGIVKGVTSGGSFENETAKIKSESNGWYRCTLSGTIYASKARIILGSTSNDKNIVSWEGKTKAPIDIKIIPSSLRIKQE